MHRLGERDTGAAAAHPPDWSGGQSRGQAGLPKREVRYARKGCFGLTLLLIISRNRRRCKCESDNLFLFLFLFTVLRFESPNESRCIWIGNTGQQLRQTLTDSGRSFGRNGAEAGEQTENVNIGKGTNKSIQFGFPPLRHPTAAPPSHCFIWWLFRSVCLQTQPRKQGDGI